MIGVITFKIKTTGKYTKDDKDEITYSMDMSTAQGQGPASHAQGPASHAQDGNIFISPTVKFAKKLSYDKDDYKNDLTNADKFKQFVKDSIKKNGETPLDKKEAITSNLNFNINFIKNIFFPQKSTFKIKGERYTVNSSSYSDGQYEITDTKKQVNGVDKNYIAHIELNLSPIPVISGLQFRIKTTKFKQVEKNEKYDSLPDPVFMFITPSVKLTMNDLHYSYISGDYKKLFTSYQDFNALVDYIAKKQDILDKRDPAYPEKSKEILNNNIKFIKNIFLPDKSKYTYRNQKFVVVKSNYIDYEAKPYADYKTSDNYKALSNSYQTLSSSVKVIYIASFDFTFLDIPLGSEEPSKADFDRLSCSEKAKVLEKQFMYYFDLDLNLFEKPKQIIVMKTEYDKAKEKLEKENKLRKEEEQRKEEDIIRKRLEEKERFLLLKKRDDERKKKEEEELKKNPPQEVKVGGKKSKRADLYKNFKKNVSRKMKKC